MRHYIKNHPVYFIEFDRKKNPVEALHYSDASSIKLHWICKNNHEWFSSPLNRNKGFTCPFCPKNKAIKENSLKSLKYVCEQGHSWLESKILYNNRKTCIRCDYNIFDAKTFISQYYPEIPIEILSIDKPGIFFHPGTFKFYEDEIYYKYPIIKSILDNYLDKTKKINSVKLKTIHPSMDEAYLFEKENSLNSTARYAYAIGLHKDNVLYQVLRYLPQKNGTLKILAISTKNGYNIAGGYSRLLRELNKKILKSGIVANKLEISINTRFNLSAFWANEGFRLKKVTYPFCLSDGFLRTSSKKILENSFKLSTEEHFLLEKDI